jgi:hypothetical protein
MWFVQFMRSMPGRALRVVMGLSLIVYGSTQGSLVGLVLMMVGMVPAVTGLANISLIEEVIKTRRASRLSTVRPRERRA